MPSEIHAFTSLVIRLFYVIFGDILTVVLKVANSLVCEHHENCWYDNLPHFRDGIKLHTWNHHGVDVHHPVWSPEFDTFYELCALEHYVKAETWVLNIGIPVVTLYRNALALFILNHTEKQEKYMTSKFIMKRCKSKHLWIM